MTYPQIWYDMGGLVHPLVSTHGTGKFRFLDYFPSYKPTFILRGFTIAMFDVKVSSEEDIPIVLWYINTDDHR